MDKKLARGLARDGFRKDLRDLDGAQTDLYEEFRPFFERILTRGKLTKSEGRDALESIAAFKQHPHHTVFLERFANPDIKALSPDHDGLIVGGNMSSRPLTLFQHEEMVRSYALFYDRFSRKSIELRMLERPIFIREHAVSRFIERSEAGFTSLTANLWPSLLFIDALEFVAPSAKASPFLLPLPTGVLLGVNVLIPPPKHIRGTYRCLVTREGIKEERFKQAGSEIQVWFMSTYVATEDLKPPQVELGKTITTLVQRHQSVLMFMLLSRVMNYSGLPDQMGLKERFSGDTLLARSEFQDLLSSDLWQESVRVPGEGLFRDVLLASGKKGD